MRHILVVDDSVGVLKSIQKFLSFLGYRVDVAFNGQDAVNLFDNLLEVDLVITDIRMPNINGNDVARHIRNSPKRETPIVAVTADKDDIDDSTLFNAILKKPFRLETLKEVIICLI